MSWLRLSMIFAILALVVDVVGIAWAVNQRNMIGFGDDRLEYWLDHIVMLFVFLLVQTAAGFLLQAIAYRRLRTVSNAHA